MPKTEKKKQKRKQRYDFKRPMSLIVHSKELSDNLDQEWKTTGKDYTVIINQRLNESYEQRPNKTTRDGD